MTAAPRRLLLRAYQVGFGDCFVLRFEYARGRARHMLIDFGSTHGGAKPVEIAEDIAEWCEGKLDVVVATHRHKDHISGFATKANGRGSGDIIRALEPSCVIQPWTEHPKAKTNATTAPRSAAARARAFVRALDLIHDAAAVAYEVGRGHAHARSIDRSLLAELAFIGDDNLTNRPAVENLMTMAPKSRTLYVRHGKRPLGLARELPGIKVTVLGPPTLEQTDTIAKQRRTDPDEFWHVLGLGTFATHAVAADGGGRIAPLFPSFVMKGDPVRARWLRRRLRGLSVERLLSIVRILDKAMNNTSVILLIEAGKKKLLFPGDAQIENWAYALEQKWVQKLLAKVDLYKVGHHGSLNATPLTLWDMFGKKRSELDDEADTMLSVMSTQPGVHGRTDSKTEVPRRSLVASLREETEHYSTTDLRRGALYEEIEIDL